MSYYDLAPKDPVENLEWRIRCRERALTDKRFRDALLQACETDVLFFFAFALWVHEPRAKVKMKPFVPWNHQEKVITAIDNAITEAMDTEHPVSVTIPKSRAQGGTYVYLGVQIRRALFEKGFSSGLVTRNEKMMDSKDPTAVMNKLSTMLDKLPLWMLDGYKRNIDDHTILFPITGSIWVGFAATSDVARGGRTTMFAFDEVGSEEFIANGIDYKIMSSVAHVTNCCAKGTLVVTDRGLVPIENVQLNDLVWDGNVWVSQDGCVYQGQKETIRSYRVGLTPDHLVFTTKGWKHAEEGFDRAEIRLPYGYRSRFFSHQARGRECLLGGQVRLWLCQSCSGQRVSGRESKCLLEMQGCSDIQDVDSSWNESYVNSPIMVFGNSEVSESKSSFVPQVWWARDNVLRSMDGVREFSPRHGRKTERFTFGKSGQRQGVLSRELLLGDHQRAMQQQKFQQADRDIERNVVDTADCGHCGCRLWCNHKPHTEGQHWGCFTSSIKVCNRVEAVYDLLNCGPRRAFTVIDDDGRPLLVHNCIVLCSTFGADTGVFYESATDTENPRVYSLDWKDNPEHARLAYVKQDGVVKAINPAEQEEVEKYIASHERELRTIERKGHKIEGKVRSPWYDSHCLVPGSTPRYIARELDMDAKGSAGKVFTTDLLDRMKREHCKKPVWRGKPVFDSETLELKGLISDENGPLSLWFKPGIDNRPTLGPFTIACDIASGGVGAFASNSVASGIDNRTGEQVLEYTVKGLEPRPFARIVVGLCLWMRNALLGWEDSGVSGGFAKEVREVCYYGNIFYRDVNQLGSQTKSRKAGFPCRDADKADMFEQFALAMESGKYTPRSEEMLVECGEYEWENGRIIHAPTKNKGATEKNHGDRAISAAGTWLVFSTDNLGKKIDSDVETGQTPEYGSYLWRERQERRSVDVGSPMYSIRDVLKR